jgi:hypothetical protein
MGEMGGMGGMGGPKLIHSSLLRTQESMRDSGMVIHHG